MASCELQQHVGWDVVTFPEAVQRGQKETVKALSRRRMHISYNWGIFTNPIAAADSCSTSWMPDLLALHRQDQVAYLPSWAPLRWKLPLQQKAARMFWSLADKVTCTQLENGPRYNMIQRAHGSDWQLFVQMMCWNSSNLDWKSKIEVCQLWQLCAPWKHLEK